MTAERILFYLFALSACGGAIAVVLSQNIVRMGFWLMVSLSSTAALFFLLHADFVAATQLLIYVGGTLVVLIFGVMLTANKSYLKIRMSPGDLVVAGGVGFLLIALLASTTTGVDWDQHALRQVVVPAWVVEGIPTGKMPEDIEELAVVKSFRKVSVDATNVRDDLRSSVQSVEAANRDDQDLLDRQQAKLRKRAEAASSEGNGPAVAVPNVTKDPLSIRIRGRIEVLGRLRPELVAANEDRQAKVQRENRVVSKIKQWPHVITNVRKKGDAEVFVLDPVWENIREKFTPVAGQPGRKHYVLKPGAELTSVQNRNLLALFEASGLQFAPHSRSGGTGRPIGFGLLGLRPDRDLNAPDGYVPAGSEFYVKRLTPHGKDAKGKPSSSSTGYLLPFEIASVHLLVVLIGAGYLARAKRRLGDDETV